MSARRRQRLPKKVGVSREDAGAVAGNLERQKGCWRCSDQECGSSCAQRDGGTRCWPCFAGPLAWHVQTPGRLGDIVTHQTTVARKPNVFGDDGAKRAHPRDALGELTRIKPGGTEHVHVPSSDEKHGACSHDTRCVAITTWIQYTKIQQLQAFVHGQWEATGTCAQRNPPTTDRQMVYTPAQLMPTCAIWQYCRREYWQTPKSTRALGLALHCRNNSNQAIGVTGDSFQRNACDDKRAAAARVRRALD